MRESLTGNHFSRVYGIMNGTCNYILTRMEKEGLSFEACLKEAQRLGYAEADPTFDIEGNDTAHKLAILTTLAFGSQIAADDIYLEGISNISIDDIHAARDLGFRIKLLGVAQRTDTGIEQRVHPTMVPLDSVIAQVDGVTNAVALESDILGELLMVGPGAGGNATASAVLGDITDIAKSRPGAQQVPVLGRPATLLEPYRQAQMRSHEGGYFIRLTVVDRTGVFASIAAKMADNAISLESIVQRSEHAAADAPVTIILVTHATMEDAVRKAVAAIKGEGYLVGEPHGDSHRASEGRLIRMSPVPALRPASPASRLTHSCPTPIDFLILTSRIFCARRLVFASSEVGFGEGLDDLDGQARVRRQAGGRATLARAARRCRARERAQLGRHSSLYHADDRAVPDRCLAFVLRASTPGSAAIRRAAPVRALRDCRCRPGLVICRGICRKGARLTGQ